jgi:NAD(P)-dependent dehydrogenase (short-subunit alcohol dehydrogenase family)
MENLKGQRYVVTGAASGIGDAVARQLLDQQATVVSLDRNKPSAPVHEHLDVDLADPTSIDQAVAALTGSIDGLLNVAGVPGTLPAETVLAVNFLGLRHLTESLWSRINPGGSIVIVSSTAGFNWAQRLPAIRELLATESFADGAEWFRRNPQEGNAYNFSKEATIVYTMATGLKALHAKLRVNAVLPGPVQTPILADFEESMGKEHLDGVKALLGRHASADDIAGPVVFLASSASDWVNGQALAVDGGLTGAVMSGELALTVPE